MLYRYARLVCPLLAALGCAGATSSPAPVSPDAAVENKPAVPSIRSGEVWTIRSDPGPHIYTSISNIMLELSAGPETNRDSMAIASRYSLRFDRTDESVPATGQIDQFLIQTGGRIGSTTQPDLPLPFSGSVTKRQITLSPVNQPQTASSSMTCPNFWSTAISGVRRNVFLVPSQMTRGMIWADTVSSMTCHGLTPVSLINSYSYQVIGEVDRQGSSAILIERTGATSSSGEGSDGQHRVTIDGKGTSLARFYLDKTTGTLLDAEDDQKTRVTITSSGRSQIFTQTVREITTLQRR